MLDTKALADVTAAVVKRHVAAAVEPLLRRIADLEARQPERGERGADGRDGTSVTLSDLEPAIAEAVRLAISALPPARDGADGKDGRSITVEDVAPLIADRVAAAVREMPTPSDGKDGRDGAPPSDEQIAAAVARHLEANPPAAGRDGNDGAPGRDGVDGKDGLPGRDGVDGKAAAPITTEDLDAAVTRHLKENPPAAGRHGRDGVDGAPGRDGLDGKDGAPGQAGADGRDGVGLAGALIDRAGQLVVTLTDGSTRELGPVIGRDGLDGTNGRDGAPGRDGFSLKDFDAELKPDGRTLLLKFADGSDVSFAVEIAFPVMIYRGVFKEGQPYERGDTVTWAGSLWHCDAGTTGRPGEGSKAWTLAAKRGRDGKEAVSLPRDHNEPVRL